MGENAPITISAENKRTIAAILDYIASDTNDVAISGNMVCHFCGRDVRQDDVALSWTIGHDAECLFMYAREVLRRLGW